MNSMDPGLSEILIVDDVEDNREILERNLVRAGYKTSTLASGVAAMERVTTNPPDLILLDWTMPELSGLDVLIAIRERYDANALPIIMCTARDESSSIVTAISAGANDYVQKPFNMTVLLARLQAQLDRKAALAALAAINSQLETTLTDRTRTLLARSAETAEKNSGLVETIVSLAEWLQSDEAGSDAARRISTARAIADAARQLGSA